MNKFIPILIVNLFLISYVYALDCQYRTNETYQELELGLYDTNGNFIGPPLEFKDFSGGGMNIAGCNPPSFKIHNTLGNDITLNISYTTEWNAPLSHPSQNRQGTISIPQYSDSDSLMGSCLDIGSGSITQESIKYIITNPELLILKNEQVTKQREICRMCGPEICLNDGAFCNPLYDNIKCGSGICNIAGFCGKKKVVDCSNGKLNCNDKICLEPSIKELGEGYDCSFECKYGGENEKCLENPEVIKAKEDSIRKKWILFGVLSFIIVLVGYWKFKEKGADEAEKRRKKAQEERDEAIEGKNIAINEKERLKEEIKRSNNELIKLKQKENNLRKEIEKEQIKSNEKIKQIKEKENKEIRILQERKKDKKVEAQRTIDEEIKKVRNDRQKEIEKAEKEKEETLTDLNSQIKKNKNLILEEKFKEIKLREKTENLTKEITEIDNTSPERKRKKLLHEYINKYETKSRKIKYDNISERFMITSQYHSPEPLSRYIYKKYINPNIGSNEIHHINYDELIDETWNLIALSKEDHNKIKHSNLDKGDWESGIEELRRIGYGTENKPFQEHIKKKIDERRKQEKLEKYAKRSFRRIR